MKNKTLASLLAFFGGPLGLHKFYLGDSGAGIFYVFLTMMSASAFSIPISMFLGIIDGLRYLMMPPEEFDRKFNKRYRRASASRRTTRSKRETYRTSKRPKKRKRDE